MNLRSFLLCGLPVVFAVATDSSVTFESVGDWGLDNAALHAVSHSMATVARAENISFVISVGDNFYEQGVASTTDPLWTTVFENNFNDTSLFCPWKVILGNHGHYTSPYAQIEYSQISERWDMPDYWFNYTVRIDDDTTIDFFFFDTLLALEYDEPIWWWLDEVLPASNATYLIVVGHYPVYSGGEHGHTPGLVSRLAPLMEKYSVDMYLSGHDHTLQHIQRGTVDYVVTGSGAKSGTVHHVDGMQFGVTTNGFTLHRATNESLTTTFYSGTGDELYSFTRLRQRTPGPRPAPQSNSSTPIIIAISCVAVALLVLVAVAVGVILRRRKRLRRYHTVD